MAAIFTYMRRKRITSTTEAVILIGIVIAYFILKPILIKMLPNLSEHNINTLTKVIVIVIGVIIIIINYAIA